MGTGPGDPELITLKAAGVLRSADVVFCFSWLNEELARFVQPGRVEVVSPLFMGGRYFRQKPEDVSAELREAVVEANAELAKFKQRVEQLVAQGKTVAFADNGDPMVFSPWSWAAHEFAQLQPVVIPGVSSFNAANAASTGCEWLGLDPADLRQRPRSHRRSWTPQRHSGVLHAPKATTGRSALPAGAFSGQYAGRHCVRCQLSDRTGHSRHAGRHRPSRWRGETAAVVPLLRRRRIETVPMLSLKPLPRSETPPPETDGRLHRPGQTSMVDQV